MEPYFSKRFDVTGRVLDLSGPLEIASWIFPAQGDDVKGVWICLPGESYTKAYYHLVVPGHPNDSYSFAAAMARQGYIVVVVDHLGTGDSTPEQKGVLFTSEFLAAANEEVVRQVNVGLTKGLLHEDLPKYNTLLPIFGIGHSLGGKLLLQQEDLYHSFDAICVTGWSNSYSALPGGIDSLFVPPMERRRKMHDYLFAADVPNDVMRADDALITVIPEGIQREVFDPLSMLSLAKKIPIPIFLCLASLVDISTNMREEEQVYPQGLVFSYELPGSHHSYNFATSRVLLWTLLSDWSRGIIRYSYS